MSKVSGRNGNGSRSNGNTKYDANNKVLSQTYGVLADLRRELSDSKAKFKIVASGSEFQTLTQSDCWSSFARERQEIFDHIVANQIEGVVLVSGDRHFTAGYQIQKRFVEYTSGPIGSGNATLQENPERFTGCDEGKLWVILDLETNVEPPRFAYEIWQAGSGMLERRTRGYKSRRRRKVASVRSRFHCQAQVTRLLAF